MLYVKTNMHFFVPLECHACLSHQVLTESIKMLQTKAVVRNKKHTLHAQYFTSVSLMVF